MKLHRKKVIIGGRDHGFPVELPDDANIEYIEEEPGGSPMFVYYSIESNTVNEEK